MAKYKQVMQVSLCGNIKRGAFLFMNSAKSELRCSKKCRRRRKRMKLYEYAEQYEALKQMAEDENIPPEALADTLESIDDEFETKVDSIACIIKDELAIAEAIKKEIDALTVKLAEATNQPKELIYREAVRNIGGNCDTVCVINSAVNKLRQMWQHNGIGWVTDVLPSKVRGCTNVIVYYGSSTYDRAQMARLIDNIVQDCRAVGVETLPPDKLEALKDEWAR